MLTVIVTSTSFFDFSFLKLEFLVLRIITLLTMKEREKEKQGLVSFERDNKGNVIKPRYELVSSHTARRSGITNLYLSGNFDTYQMMSISGHRDEKTFYEYIKLSSDEVADSIAKKMDERKEAISNERLF